MLPKPVPRPPRPGLLCVPENSPVPNPPPRFVLAWPNPVPPRVLVPAPNPVVLLPKRPPVAPALTHKKKKTEKLIKIKTLICRFKKIIF